MNILVCNAGSTSLKFKLFSYPGKSVLASGKVERVGGNDAIYHFSDSNRKIFLENQTVPDYITGVKRFLGDLGAVSIDAVGFKTVLAKGYPGVSRIDADVMRGMEEYLSVAPAHNRAYLEVVRAFQNVMPDTPLVGSFETAFHMSIPMERRVYGLPYALTEKYGIYKMGYHGASHSYVAKTLKDKRRVISCHLGGSGSVCAILDGKSVDNSFGLSLQAGILSGSRAGDIDPYIIPFLLGEGMTIGEITRALDKEGGLLGISGVSGDMRALREAADAGNPRAKLAIDVYINGIVRYIGAYYAELGGLDAIAFTGGVGEHDSELRREVINQVSHFGIELDAARNAENGFVISKDSSKVAVFVIPADEESGVADNTYRLLMGGNNETD